MKIAFIGGGSVQWTPKLVTDVALNRPLAVGPLPHPAYAAIASHVARQELIVEAALTGRRAPALAALATDPLVHDPTTVAPMLDELLAANADFMGPDFIGEGVTFNPIKEE